MSQFAGWGEAVAWERIADLHREAERERLVQRVREGRSRPLTSGGLSARGHSARGRLGALRQLLGPVDSGPRNAGDTCPWSAPGNPIEVMSDEA